MAVAIDKYVCPFCGQKTLFVGVHDDEGNYKGRPGCDYESNSWSGLCYAIHHDGWGDCILCTDAHGLPLGGCFFDTEKEALEAIPTLTPPNEWVKVMEAINNAAVAYIEGGPYENDLPGMEFALKIDRLSRDFVRPPEGEADA